MSSLLLNASTPTVLFGGAGQSGLVDGQGTAARFSHPTGLVYDGRRAVGRRHRQSRASSRRLDVRHGQDRRQRRRQSGPRRRPGATAQLDQPFHMQRTPDAELVFVESEGQVARIYDPASDYVATILGVPAKEGAIAGTAPASLGDPRGIVMLPTGQLLVGSSSEAVIQRLLTRGTRWNACSTKRCAG